MSKPIINVCLGSSCFARGNEANLEAITDFMTKHNLQDEIDVELSCCLCQGNCTKGPNISINNKQYHVANPAVITDMLKQLFNTKLAGINHE